MVRSISAAGGHGPALAVSVASGGVVRERAATTRTRYQV
jgi:hypothetical protein